MSIVPKSARTTAAETQVVAPKQSAPMRQMITTLKHLRTLVTKAETEMFRAARKFEIEQKDIWRQFYTTFDAVLEDNDICDSKRYRNFVAADQTLGEETVDAMGGAKPAIEAMKIEDRGRRSKFVEAASERFKKDEVPWSEQEASRQRRNIGGQPPRDSSYNRDADRKRELEESAIALKKEIQTLKKQIKERDEEIAELKKQLSKLKK